MVNQAALERFDAAVADARLTGEVLDGRQRLTDGHHANGNYVAPTVVRVPDDSTIWTTELFAAVDRRALGRLARRGAGSVPTPCRSD